MPDLVFATKGQAAVLRAQEDMKRQAQAINEEFKKTTREADQAKNAILKIFESTKTPAEKLKQQMDQLRKAMKDGIAPPGSEEALARLKAKHTEALQSMQKEATKAKDTMSDLGEATEDAFDSGRLQTFGSALTAMAPAALAIARAFREIAADRERASQSDKTAVLGEGLLSQLATSPGELQSLLAESRGMFAMGAGRDRNESAATLFSLVNAGLEGDENRPNRLFFARMRAAGLVGNAGEMAKAAATLQSTLGGNMQDIINRGFGAGAFSPGSIEQLFVGASRGGTGASALGIGINELIGSTAALAKATGSEMEAGTLIQSLLKSLDKAGGFQGKTLAQSLAEIRGRVAKGENLRGDSLLGGRQEAVNAYRILTGGGASDFAAATAAAAQGGMDRTASQRLRVAESTDPNLRAARLAIRTGQARDVSNPVMEQAAFQSVIESIRNEDRASMDKLHWLVKPVFRAGLSAAETIDQFNDPEQLARDLAKPRLFGGDSEAQKEAREIIKSIDDQRKIQRDMLRVLQNIDNKSNDGGLLIGGD